MSYTVERLELAKDITKREKYNLRKLQTKAPTSLAWVDDNDAEDYDPQKEGAHWKRKRRKTAETGDAPTPDKIAKELEAIPTDLPRVSESFLDSLPIYQDNGDEEDEPASIITESQITLPRMLKGEEKSGLKHKSDNASEAPQTAQSRYIWMSLAHPICFDYDPPEDGSKPCHWCDNFTYGILGLGKRKVEVLDHGDGRYIETSAGHVKDGHEPSRMCISCALEKIRITRCSGHQVIPLTGYIMDSFDFDAAYATLLPSSGQKAPTMKNPWCSLCPNPAFFGCATLQDVDENLDPIDAASPEARGCGLLLCEPCEILMSGAGGDLAQVVAMNEQDDAEAATRRAQLTVTTSSTKRRKVAEPRRPGALPGLSFASQAGRRHGRLSSDLSSPPPKPPRPSSPSGSNRSKSSSASPPPRYIPAHLQDEVLGAKSQATARLPAPDSSSSSLEFPSAACAGLTLASDPATDMSGSEKREDSIPPPRGGGDDAAAVGQPSPPNPKREAPKAEPDVEMDLGDTERDLQPRSDNADPMDTAASDDDSTGNDGNSGSDNAYHTPSSMSTYTAPIASTHDKSQTQGTTSPAERPSYDDQVARVTCFMIQPLQENQKGYVMSSSWLKRVLARSSTHADNTDKTATEGEIGPVDNSDLVLVTDPANTGFKDEHGEPFVPLRPGLQMGEDYEVVPQEGWDLIMQWYGLAEQSPAITRYAHNTNSTGESENIQYEINPPVYTILKLSNPSSGTTPQVLKEKAMLPKKALSSRQTNFQKWLKQAKELVNIDMSTKVRVWRVLGGLGSASASAAITPAASRSASPAPFASLVSNAGSNMVLDLNTFLSLSEGSQRELLEDAKDQTANPNYNGRMTLDLAGLGDNDIVVLEERVSAPGGGEWVSEASKQTLSRLGVPSGSLKTNLPSKLKTKSPTTSGRSSPVQEPIRGRRKDGKPRGNTGLSNLGNTCYMNSALQCVRSVEELTYYFLNDIYKKDLNPSNPLAHNGDVAKAYANLLRMIFDENGQSSFAPRQLKQTIGRYGPAFSGYGQQDSQEFLLFLLDGLQEDLNRIQKKPYIEKPDSTDEMVHDKEALHEFAEKCWDIYKARNDSVITDLFAGMYKSTLVCPVCDKVSIIFDPFNNLTLQLPVENLWSKEIFYFPLHKKPVLIDVEFDKNSSIKALKEHIAKKMDADPQRLVMAEIYKFKFYKMFDNNSSIADYQISSGDDIGIFEVESVPTNYNPDKVTQKSFYSFGRTSHEEVPSFDSPMADRMIIPVFHRYERSRPATYRNPQRSLFGVPLYVIINREEAKDYDSILRKVLAQAATMTTRDFLNEEVPGDSPQDVNAEDSDTVIMNEDDAESADSKIKTASVDGEEGMVDVSMRDASDSVDITPSQDSTREMRLKSSVPSRFHSLFEMKVVKTSEAVPLGFSSLDDHKDYPKITSRIKPKPAVVRPAPRPTDSANEDEESEEAPASEKKAGDDESTEDKAGSSSDNEMDLFNGPARPTTPKPQRQQRPLVCPGEAIVLDWTEDAHDALFGGDARDSDPVRGAPTWTNVERVSDPELANRRALRQRRKKRGVTLAECLDEFNKEEILSENDAWYCPRCKEHRRASKKFELWKTPDILVMHLKRFSASRGFRDKLDILVDFPVDELDLTGRVEAPEEGKSLVYDLFAVDNHYGGLGGGHYTAYAKNFMTGQWNEYNDSSVSRPIDPQSVITSSAYLLFYRRRSDRPLGGKILEEITESSTRPGSESDSQGESRGQSPSGEGRRLGDSSRNGSSSALAGVGAAHQLGDGGLRIGARLKNRDDDMLPEYSNSPSSGEQSLGRTQRLEGMNFDEDEFGNGALHNSFRSPSPPSWSFNRVTDAHGPSQMTVELPGSISDDDDLIDDNDSNKAVGGGDISDSDLRLASLTDSPLGPVPVFPGTPMDESLPPLDADNDGDDDDDLPVVELHVNDEERLVSD